MRSVDVSPDGRALASCGEDGVIKLWDMRSRQHLAMLRSDRSYERLNINGMTGISGAQKVTLHALGAIEEGTAPR